MTSRELITLILADVHNLDADFEIEVRDGDGEQLVDRKFETDDLVTDLDNPYISIYVTTGHEEDAEDDDSTEKEEPKESVIATPADITDDSPRVRSGTTVRQLIDRILASGVDLDDDAWIKVETDEGEHIETLTLAEVTNDIGGNGLDLIIALDAASYARIACEAKARSTAR